MTRVLLLYFLHSFYLLLENTACSNAGDNRGEMVSRIRVTKDMETVGIRYACPTASPFLSVFIALLRPGAAYPSSPGSFVLLAPRVIAGTERVSIQVSLVFLPKYDSLSQYPG